MRLPVMFVTGNALNICLVAFSEPPSDSTWLENAPNDPPTKKPTAPKRDGLF